VLIQIPPKQRLGSMLHSLMSWHVLPSSLAWPAKFISHVISSEQNLH
jgi:hypothetical protein